MSSLPEELYLDILLRVPVKSTFVCKCVCKSWYKLISDPDFVKVHLDCSYQRNNCGLILKSNKEPYWLYSSNDGVVVELEAPYKYLRQPRGTELMGSCDGLVYGWNNQIKSFFLWNPTTKKYKKLPKSKDSNGYDRLYGFGYDYKTKDYKLVSFLLNEKKQNFLTEVYSLKSNSWKSWFQSNHWFGYTVHSGVLLNGALHWLLYRQRTVTRCILSIDMSEERFEELQLPTTPTLYWTDPDIVVLQEYLCVCAPVKESLEIWVMQNYGVADSWTKLYTITYESITCCRYRSDLKLIGSFKNGEILFMKSNFVFGVIYDPKNGTARKFEIDDLRQRSVVIYVESLVSPNSGTAVGERKKREITRNLTKTNTKKRNRELNIAQA